MTDTFVELAEISGIQGDSESKFRRYSKSDDEFLLRNAPAFTLIELSEFLDRSEASIAKRLARLGIPGSFRRKPLVRDDLWSAEELALLADPTLSRAEIAARTGRTLMAVRIKASLRGDVHVREYHPSGPDHPRYRGGTKTSERGKDWPDVRLVALERDGYACQDCGVFSPSGAGLCVHHVIPYRLLASNDLAWLVTLCVSCHMSRPEHMWVEIPEDVMALRFAGGN